MIDFLDSEYSSELLAKISRLRKALLPDSIPNPIATLSNDDITTISNPLNIIMQLGTIKPQLAEIKKLIALSLGKEFEDDKVLDILSLVLAVAGTDKTAGFIEMANNQLPVGKTLFESSWEDLSSLLMGFIQMSGIVPPALGTAISLFSQTKTNI